MSAAPQAEGRRLTAAAPLDDRPMVKPPGKSWRVRLDDLTHPLLVLPGIALLLALVVYPVGWNVYNSFTNRNLTFPDTSLVGLDNYRDLFSDPSFWKSIGRTGIWTLLSVAGQLLLGIVGALALQRVRRGQAALRLALIVPWAFPSIVLAFSWRFMLDGLYGVVNDVGMRLGLIDSPIPFLGDEDLALASVIVMNIWFGFPFMMVALLAGLQTIPRDQYESAGVDGATAWQETRYITLPALRNLIGALVLLRGIWVFNNFDFVFLTTGGGPVDRTETLPVFAFGIGWANYQIGRMAAVSVALLLILAVCAFGYFLLTRYRRGRS